MSSVDDLVAFLRVQTDADERIAPAVHSEDCALHNWLRGDIPSSCDCGWPARALREVEAKRRILDALPSDDGYDAGRAKFSDYESCDDSCVGQVMHEVVKLLALPYVDREGYREEWKP